MMQTIQKNRSLIIAVVIFAIVIWTYSTFFKPDDSGLPVDVNTQTVGSDVLSLYASLQSVTIDQNLFSSPLYRNLIDFSRALENQPAGRPNPFEVIGRD